MIGNDLLELLGGAPVILAFLAIMWKGDEALSKDARDDLALWLMCSNIRQQRSLWIAGTLRAFERVFGTSPFKRKFIYRSLVLTVVVGLSSFAIASNVIPASVFDVFHTADEPKYLRDLIQLDASFYFWTGVIFLAFNAVPDYISLSFSRFALSRVESSGRLYVWLPIDFLVSVLCIPLTIAFAMVLLVPFGGLINEYAPPGLILALEAALEAGFLLFASALTAIAVSTWIWLAGFGSSLIRLLSRLQPLLDVLRYILPIEEKPVRFIGLCGMALTLFFLLGTSAITNLL